VRYSPSSCRAGLLVSHEAIDRWCLRSEADLEVKLRKRRPRTRETWLRWNQELTVSSSIPSARQTSMVS
jgi:hypothetical protein